MVIWSSHVDTLLAEPSAPGAELSKELAEASRGSMYPDGTRPLAPVALKTWVHPCAASSIAQTSSPSAAESSLARRLDSYTDCR